jgi:hypothetical protein
MYFVGSNKFKYVPGTTYVYDYTANTLTSVRGATKEKSQLHISATARFHVVSECDFVLQVICECLARLRSGEWLNHYHMGSGDSEPCTVGLPAGLIIWD